MTKHKKSTRKHKNPSRNNQSARDRADSPADETAADGLLYTIEKSDALGRYLTASRNLSAGEVIMEEDPLVVGPCQESEPLCLGCYTDLTLEDITSYVRCSGCQWPLCSQHCPGLHKPYGHSLMECQLLSNSKPSAIPPAELATWYFAITPLRCLALQSQEGSWQQVTAMESHDEARRGVEKLWRGNQRRVVDRIKGWGLHQFEEGVIHRVCGVLEVNSFEVHASSSQPLRAIYPTACLFAHDCVPNTAHADAENCRLVVRTAVPVPAGSLLTVSYTYTLQSTPKRRKHLMDTKFFSCSCRRCSDPRELSSYTGALKCPLCPAGLLLSEQPLELDAGWKCDGCGKYKMSGENMDKVMDRLTTELDNIDGNDIAGYEHFLQQHSPSLHDNHYQRLSALHSLSQVYGKVSGYMIYELTDELLERKIEICRELLAVFAVLEPGLSRQRGILLYELQAPLMIQMRKRYDERNIPKKDLKVKLKEICKCLEETIKILAHEHPGSNEGQIVLAAKDALDNLQCWHQLVANM